MKKVIFGAAVAATAMFGAYTAQQKSNEMAMNDLQIENVELLADGEPYYGVQKVTAKEKSNGQIVLKCKGKGSLVCESTSQREIYVEYED